MTRLFSLSPAQIEMLRQAVDGVHVTADTMARENLSAADSLLRLGLIALHEEGAAMRFRLTEAGRKAREDALDAALGSRSA